MHRPGVFNLQKHKNYDMLKVHALTYESLLEDEENQIRGFVYVVDAAKIGLQHLTLFTPQEAVRIAKNAGNLILGGGKKIRSRQDSNLRSQSESDFESDALVHSATTATVCL